MPKRLFLCAVIVCLLICLHYDTVLSVSSKEKTVTSSSDEENSSLKKERKKKGTKKKRKKKTKAVVEKQQRQSELLKVNKKDKRKSDGEKVEVETKEVQSDKTLPVAQPAQSPTSSVALPAQSPTSSVALPAQSPTSSVALPAQSPASPVALPAQSPTSSVALPAQSPTSSVALPAQSPASPVALPAQSPASPVAQPAESPSQATDQNSDNNGGTGAFKAADCGINEALQKKIDEAIDTHPENIIRLKGYRLTDENLRYVVFKIKKVFSEAKEQAGVKTAESFVLDISDNEISDVAPIHTIVVEFPEMLVHLNMSGNPVGDRAITVFGTLDEKGILLISKLRSLKLAKCGITNADSLFAGLQKSPNSAGMVDLSGNQITDPHAIVMFLQSPNGVITKVNLSGNPLSAEGLQELQRCKGSIIFNRSIGSAPLPFQPTIKQR